MAKQRRPGTPERNPLGLGANDRESSNTGSIEDTAYDAVASDPYLTGEPRKEFARRVPDVPDEEPDAEQTADERPPRTG
jgi:hypothetical protein